MWYVDVDLFHCLQVQKLKGKLNKSEELTMQQKSKLLAKQVEDTRSALREGEVNNMRGKYFLTRLFNSYVVAPHF